MPAAVFVVPGRLDARTGGSIYDRRMVEGLRRLGWAVEVMEVTGLDEASRLLSGVPYGMAVVVDSLVLGAIPEVVTREARRIRIVALMHLPLSADPALDPAAAHRVEHDERRAIRAAVLVIVTGAATCALLRRYGLAQERIVVIEPGTDRAPLARGSGSRTVQVLCVATLNPGKGHEMLLSALAAVPHDRWQLACAGSLTRDAATAARVRAAVARLGLGDRVSLLGDLDGPALAEAYDRADLFALATRQETYGMAVAEALARGLPVVSTSTGAIPELVGRDAGLVVPVGDLPALIAALSRAIGDSEYRAHLAAGARRVREELRSWEEASARMADALASLQPGQAS